MIPQNIFFMVLMDFLRELPQGFDRDKTTYAEACDIVKNFMEMHGLTDEAMDKD